MEDIHRSLGIAMHAHHDQKRRVSGAPYLVHLLDVMKYLLYEDAPKDVIIAGILHDTLEDTDYTTGELEADFGKDVLSLVQFATEPGNTSHTSHEEMQRTWKARKQDTINRCDHATHNELLLSLADKLANLNALREDHDLHGDTIWEKFGGGKEGMRWYFEKLGKIFRTRLGETRMYRFYEETLPLVFTKS